jgi:hypothetical protein
MAPVMVRIMQIKRSTPIQFYLLVSLTLRIDVIAILGAMMMRIFIVQRIISPISW